MSHKLVPYSGVQNKTWDVWKEPDGYTEEQIKLVVLLDIREELNKLNRVMQCSNVAAGFRALSKIAKFNEAAFKRRVNNAVRKRLKRKGL